MTPPLNAAQRDAVETLSGPLLVLAGAGTGKTRVVTYRIAELVKHGVAPQQILAVTFTNKAAAEMDSRAMSLLGTRWRERPEISTFHSLCVRILRRHIQRLGYTKQFAIYDRSDQEGAARAALREVQAPSESLRPRDLIGFISRWKTASVRPVEAVASVRSDKEHLAALAYARYQRALKAAGAVDFDDLLLLVEELFERHREVREAEAARFRHLLIDEYQDTNGPQYRITKSLAAAHRNLCVVGDDDQAIYGWRGAEVTHILRFERDWPDAKVIRLEENYRSKEGILAAANRLIAFNRHRHAKTLRATRASSEPPRMVPAEDEAAEAQWVVGDMLRQISAGRAAPRDFAILFRTNEQPRAFEAELRRARLPYVLIGGYSFFDRKEVRDILAYFKVVVNAADEVSLLRIINTPPRGIGVAAVKALMDEAVRRRAPLWDVVASNACDLSIAAAAKEGVRTLRVLVERFRQRAARESPLAVATDLVQETAYRQEIERLYREPNERLARWSSVEEVINSLAGYVDRQEQPSLAGFLDEVALLGREDTSDKEQRLENNAVALMTIHAAKGLEFSQVYLVGMEEELLPHRRAIETGSAAIDEERRLCYVGITRAKDHLTLTWAQERRRWGKLRSSTPSRFLLELQGETKEAPAAVYKPVVAG